MDILFPSSEIAIDSNLEQVDSNEHEIGIGRSMIEASNSSKAQGMKGDEANKCMYMIPSRPLE
jgi:hypothetical protein